MIEREQVLCVMKAETGLPETWMLISRGVPECRMQPASILDVMAMS